MHVKDVIGTKQNVTL